VALLAAVGFAATLAVLGALFLRPSVVELTMVEKDGRRLQALALAEAGVAQALSRLPKGKVGFEIEERGEPTGSYEVKVEPVGEDYGKVLIKAKGMVTVGGGEKLAQFVHVGVEVTRSEEGFAYRVTSWESYSREPEGS